MSPLRGFVVLAVVSFLLVSLPASMRAHEPHTCPDGFPDAPALSRHLEQADIASEQLKFKEIFEAGQRLFEAVFNICDGQGRPATTGTGAPRIPDQPAFIRTSAPDANACAGCHIQPRSGGGGDFVVNVFVLAQALDPVTESIASAFSNERNTLGLFGAGPIEMLAREMTADLQAQAAALGDGTYTLVTKGVEFEVTIQGGAVLTCKGVDPDLIIKPFHQAGVVRSIREFTDNAMNHHHGMQAEERFGLSDVDGDGIARELMIGDVTAATLFQAALGTPGRLLPADPQARQAVDHGEMLFAQIGCANCHRPVMTLNSPLFVEPNPLNPPGTFNDPSQSIVFDMTKDGEKPRLEKAPGGGAIVRAYTDLKRHNLCDDPDHPDPIRFFCNEQLGQGRPDQDEKPGAEFFITRKLWDVGNSAPYGHRGDLTTIAEAILVHGGEARAARDAFVALPFQEQTAIVRFLKTLQVLPPGSPLIVIR